MYCEKPIKCKAKRHKDYFYIAAIAISFFTSKSKEKNQP